MAFALSLLVLCADGIVSILHRVDPNTSLADNAWVVYGIITFRVQLIAIHVVELVQP